MAEIHIRIGEVATLDTENWQTIPDDRQQQVEIIGGSVVQDFGRVPEGDRAAHGQRDGENKGTKE